MIADTAPRHLTVFDAGRQIATGTDAEIAAVLADRLTSADHPPVIIVDDATGRTVDLELRHPAPVSEKPGRGRPRLGVVAREVTLLPRQWEWLSGQPGGASVALRRLVDEARRANSGVDRQRRARDSAYHAMSTLAGDLPGFEEASRALFHGDDAGFRARIAGWPADIGAYLLRLLAVPPEVETCRARWRAGPPGGRSSGSAPDGAQTRGV